MYEYDITTVAYNSNFGKGGGEISSRFSNTPIDLYLTSIYIFIETSSSINPPSLCPSSDLCVLCFSLHVFIYLFT